MGGGMETGIELSISCSDTMINYQFSQKLKLLGNSEFNHLIIILTSNNKIFIRKKERPYQRRRTYHQTSKEIPLFTNEFDK